MTNMVKKLFLVLISVVTGLSSVQALEYEIIKTSQSPGFFAVTLFKEVTPSTPCSELLVIKNFPQTERKQYQALEQQIKLQKSENCPQSVQIEESFYLGRKTPNSNQKVIILGKKIQDFPNFSLKKHSKKDFQKFLKIHASAEPLFMAKPQIEFNQNLSEIATNAQNINAGKPFVITGKFTEETPSALNITGKNPKTNLPMKFTINLDLGNKELANHPLSKDLPAYWNKLKNTPNESFETPKKSYFMWFLVLGGLILLTVFLAGQYLSKKNEKEKLKAYLDNSPDTIKKSHKLNIASLPFEVEKRKSKK